MENLEVRMISMHPYTSPGSVVGSVILPCLQELVKDDDADVRYFSEESLATEKPPQICEIADCLLSCNLWNNLNCILPLNTHTLFVHLRLCIHTAMNFNNIDVVQ